MNIRPLAMTEHREMVIRRDFTVGDGDYYVGDHVVVVRELLAEVDELRKALLGMMESSKASQRCWVKMLEVATGQRFGTTGGDG